MIFIIYNISPFSEYLVNETTHRLCYANGESTFSPE